MEKPVKSRRRRSIRNLRRASTGFSPPPAASAPYGSAWIDQDQETNMDNLVMSLSLLQASDVPNDGDCQEDGLGGQRHLDSPPSSLPTHCEVNSGLVAAVHDGGATESKSFSSSILHSNSNEDGTSPLLHGQVGEEATSEFGKLTESFSFSPDMPLCWNISEKYAKSPANCYITNMNGKSYNTSLVTSDTYEDRYKSYARETSHGQGTETHRHTPVHHLDDVEVERGNDSSANLSMNFSPVPESDKTVDYLLASMSYDSDLSFSSPGNRPNTPEISPHLLFDACTKQAVQLSQVTQEQSLIDDVLSPPMDVINNITFTPNTSDRSSPLDLDRSHDNNIRDSDRSSSLDLERSHDNDILDSSSLSEEFPSVILENQHGDKTDNSNTTKVDEVNWNNDSRPQGSWVEVQSDQNFVNFVADIASELEIIQLGETPDDSNTSHYDQSIVLGKSSYSAQKGDTGTYAQNSFDLEQNMKRARRRTSRKFTREEISNSLFHSEEFSSSGVHSLPLAVDKAFNNVSSFFSISESDKENIESAAQELQDNSSESVETVLSEVSNTSSQNVTIKKKRGRKSNSFCKAKASLLIENSELIENSATTTTNECTSQKHCDTNSFVVKDVGFGDKRDHISQSHLDGRETCASELPCDSDLHSSNHEQDQTDNDGNAIPARSLRTRNNRKSWGDLSLRQTPGKKQQQPVLENMQNSETDLSELDVGRLGQVYLQKKYSPVQPRALETIKEVIGNGRTFFGRKSKRSIHFPENYRPTVVKQKMRVKKAGKNLKKRPGYCPIDHDDFQTKLLEIQALIESDE